MRKTALLIIALASLTLGLAGCGGDDQNVPDGAVAVVDGEQITKSEFDALIARAKLSYGQNKRPFPKVGTPEYKTVQNQAVQYLVQQEKYRQKADDLDVDVSDTEVDGRLKQVKQQYFQGKEAEFLKSLKSQGLTVDQVREEIKSQLLSEKIYAKVTSDVKVTDDEVGEYYNKHQADYKVAASRDVRHILVAKKALADDIHNQLENGGNFAALAKKYSTDPGSKQNGGKLTVRKGETVPEFDKVAFELKKNELSAPVKTQYGYHIIEALSDVKPPSTTPLKDVKEQIRQQLLQEKRQKAITDWSKDTNDEFKDKIAYQVGYAPPATTGNTTTARSEPRRGAARPAASDRAPSARLSLGPRADCGDDRAAHGRGGLRGRGRRARGRRREAARRARRPALPGLLPRPPARGAWRRRPRGGRARRAREARPTSPSCLRRRRSRDSRAVRENWELIKREQEGREGVFHHVPENLPALLLARKVQRRAAAVGFEYPDVAGALADLDDELRELHAELREEPAPEPPDPRRLPSSATCSSPRSTSRVG